MKRILLSMAVGLGLVTAYMMFSSITFILAGEHKELVPYLDLPVRLPKAVFFRLFPPTAEDYFSPLMTQRKILLMVFFYLANVMLYSIPAYILIRLITRKGRRSQSARAGPPPPPTFVR
jgi:hypothetical protein